MSDAEPVRFDCRPRSLAELEACLRRDLLYLQQPAKDWVPPRSHPEFGRMLDVAVVGAGMGGLAAGFALKRLGVINIRLFDRSEPGFEGPWETYARMETLRSPKELAGPALGLANLTFRAWFEAQFGPETWEPLGRIPRPQWMAYLRWYRKVADLPIENRVALTGLAGDDQAVILSLRDARGERRVTARHLVLATGRDGLGGPFVPPLFRKLDRRRWAHTSDPIDFAALKGKRVAVVGAGASAVDNAAEALEAGAARVAMLVRRGDVPRVNKGMGVAHPGMSLGFHDLRPDERWAMTQYIADCAIPPPRNSMLRASRHGNFAVLTGCATRDARAEGAHLVLDTTRGTLAFDFVILATGFTVDWAQRPELAALAGRVALWRDRFQPDGAEGSEFAEHPFLGPGFEFVEKSPGMLPWAGRVHCFNFAATLSHGKITGDIPAVSTGAERVAEAIAGALFVEDYDAHYRRLLDYETPELLGDEWVASDSLDVDEEDATEGASP